MYLPLLAAWAAAIGRRRVQRHSAMYCRTAVAVSTDSLGSSYHTKSRRSLARRCRPPRAAQACSSRARSLMRSEDEIEPGHHAPRNVRGVLPSVRAAAPAGAATSETRWVLSGHPTVLVPSACSHQWGRHTRVGLSSLEISAVARNTWSEGSESCRQRRWGYYPWGYALSTVPDTPKNTPTSASLENTGATESSTCGRTLSVRLGEIEPPPRVRIRNANEGSIVCG